MDKNIEALTVEWKGLGYELCSTGGGYWAAFRTVDHVQVMLTNDEDESLLPDPGTPLTLQFYDDATGEQMSDGLERFPDFSTLEPVLSSLIKRVHEHTTVAASTSMRVD